MAAYRRPKRRATRKTGTRTAPPKKRKKKSAAVTTVRKRIASKPKRKRVVPRPKKRKKKVAAKRPHVIAKKRVAAKKPPAKKKRVARKPPEKKKRVAPRKPPAKKRSSRARLREEKKRVDRKLERIRLLEEEARKTKRRSAARRKVREAKAALEEERKKRLLVPSLKPKRVSLEDRWDVMSSRWNELLEYGRRTSQLPELKKKPLKIDTRLNTGVRRYVLINLVVDDFSIEQIIYRIARAAERMPQHHSTWIAQLVFSGLGEYLFGSGIDTLKKDGDVDAVFFQTQAFDSTGVWSTRELMIASVRKMLENFTDHPRGIVYLHWVEISTFSIKPSAFVGA